MAREITDIFSEIYSHYPTAFGAAGQDSTLQLSLVKFTNSLLNAIDTDRRWSLSYITNAVSTVSPTAIYAIPAGMTAISHLYWLTAQGTPVTLQSFDIQELRRTWGDGTASQAGQPRYYAVIGSNVQIFPAPDNSGPQSGNYTLYFEGYTRLTQIVQTTGTTTAGNATLTVPSSAYLTARGVPLTGSYLSVAGAGNLGPNSVADTHLTNWTAFPLATTVTMGTNAITAATSVNCYFNSVNWVIQNFDHVVLFGVLREVAAYLKENFQTWHDRYELAMTYMAQQDVDRRKSMESQGVGVTGQDQTQLTGMGRSGAWAWGAGYW